MTASAVQTTLEKPHRHGGSWLERLARVGLAAKGVSYAIVAWLALDLALGGGGKATSRNGALATIADEALGKALLLALALGFACYALWRLAAAVFDREDEGTGPTGLAKRAGYVGRAIIYGSLTVTAVRLVLGAGGGGSQNAEARRTTATVLDLPAGRWLVAAGGLAVIGAGAFNVYRAVSGSFEKKWGTGRIGASARRWGARAAVFGLAARGVVFALIGLFLVKAAWEFDPKEAIGLDGALQRLAGQAYGSWLLGIAALGLLAYGVYCLVDAHLRRV